MIKTPSFLSALVQLGCGELVAGEGGVLNKLVANGKTMLKDGKKKLTWGERDSDPGHEDNDDSESDLFPVPSSSSSLSAIYCRPGGDTFEMGIGGGDDGDDEMIFVGDVDPNDDSASDAVDADVMVFPARLLALVFALVKRTSSSSSGPIPVIVAKRFILAATKGPPTARSSWVLVVIASCDKVSETGLVEEDRS